MFMNSSEYEDLDTGEDQALLSKCPDIPIIRRKAERTAENFANRAQQSHPQPYYDHVNMKEGIKQKLKLHFESKAKFGQQDDSINDQVQRLIHKKAGMMIPPF
jgi:hypothetical protein